MKNTFNIREYLLGLGSEEEREKIEEFIFMAADKELCDLVLAQEELLFEEFIDGELTNDEKLRFTAIYNTNEALEQISLIKELRKSAQNDKTSKFAIFLKDMLHNLKSLSHLKVEIVEHY